MLSEQTALTHHFSAWINGIWSGLDFWDVRKTRGLPIYLSRRNAGRL